MECFLVAIFSVFEITNVTLILYTLSDLIRREVNTEVTRDSLERDSM